MRGIPIFTDEFDEFRIDHDSLVDFDRPRLGISLGIVDGDFDFQRPEGRTAKLFCYLRVSGERTAANVEPKRFVIAESRRFDYQRVSLPLSDRITVPPRLDIVFFRQRPA